MATHLKRRVHPVAGWILFIPIFIILQTIVRKGLGYLLIKLLFFFWPNTGGFWGFYGKLDFITDGFSLLVCILVCYIIYFLLKISILICPIPKIASWIFFSIMCLAVCVGIYSLVFHLYIDSIQCISISVTLITNVFIGICLLIIILGDNVRKVDSWCYNEI